MRLAQYFFLALLLLLNSGGNVAAEDAAKDMHVAYEMPVYKTSQQQSPGTHLNGPGDTYRYTFIIDDDYSNNPGLRIKLAIVGVHVLDEDWHKDSGDSVQEWGRILINGEPRKWTDLPFLQKMGYRAGQTPKLSNLYEIEADGEVCDEHLPPYIFNVTDFVEKDRKLTIEITNTRSDGTIRGTAPFGDFTVLRVGLRVTWTDH